MGVLHNLREMSGVLLVWGDAVVVIVGVAAPNNKNKTDKLFCW